MLYDEPPVSNDSEPLRRPARPRTPWILAVLILLVALSFVASYLYYREPRARESPPSPGANESESAAPERPPARERRASPSLDGSDSLVREMLGGLSAERAWLAWLAGEDLVRRMVAAAAAVAEGRSPRFAAEGLPFSGRFAVTSRGGRLFVAESSYERYDGIAAAARALDPAKVRAAWLMLRPLAESAWAEIAPDPRTLDQMVRQAVEHLLATPEVSGPIEVTADGAIYRFREPRLEAASPAQKHLLRMGAANADAILDLLRSLRSRLEPQPRSAQSYAVDPSVAPRPARAESRSEIAV